MMYYIEFTLARVYFLVSQEADEAKFPPTFVGRFSALLDSGLSKHGQTQGCQP